MDRRRTNVLPDNVVDDEEQNTASASEPHVPRQYTDVYQDNDDEYHNNHDDELTIREPNPTHAPAHTQDETTHGGFPVEISDVWSVGQQACATAPGAGAGEDSPEMNVFFRAYAEGLSDGYERMYVDTRVTADAFL
jgi:hypothetical protein